MRGCTVVSHLQARPNQSHAARIALGIRAGDVVCDTRRTEEFVMHANTQ